MNNIKWYDLSNILKHEAQYYIIFGERSNGKSYAVDKYIIDKFFESGCKSQFAFVKRYEEDIKTKYMSEVFNPFIDYILEKYNHHVKFYRGQWLVYEDGTEGKLNDCKVMGYAFSLANVNRTKATSYPNIDTILFEEFMSIDCSYLNDELNLFLNLVSTIVRYRHNVKIFMLANAISKYSPYSTALSLKLHRLKKGEITTKEYTDNKGFSTRFAIERSENVNVFDNSQNKTKVVYNNFGNSGVGKMITTGDFETHAYPRKVGNVTFYEYGEKGDNILSKKDSTRIAIRFEDYYYRILLKLDKKYILGFREIEKEQINKKNFDFVINGNENFKDVVNISNLAFYDNDNVNRLINIIVATLRQGDFVTMTDDDGENIINAFRLAKINI